MKKKVLMIYPEIRDSFWGYKYILPYMKKKSNLPPLGLLTIAALMPDRYEITLVDLNTAALRETDLEGADLVFLSVAAGQKDSFEETMRVLRRHDVPLVIGGPYPTSFYRQDDAELLFNTVADIDHYIIGEAELVFPGFIGDFEKGRARRVYVGDKIDMTKSPVPRYDLIDATKYAGMGLQYSRGCPFNCEFCEITYLFGKRVRTKSAAQVIAELDAIYGTGFRGSLFIVDDNFIMSREGVMPLLERIIAWQKERGYPFFFLIQTSINLSCDDEMLSLLVDAGVSTVFIGIESPHEGSLIEMSKHQNVSVDLHEAVEKIQSAGIEVSAGFIVGFDNDPENIAELQVDFIQKAGIVKAMVGLLQLSPNTRLYQRLKRENRILEDVIPTNNTHLKGLNYMPRIGKERLVEGYYKILAELYKPKNYYKRCAVLLKRLSQGKPLQGRKRSIDVRSLMFPFLRIILRQVFSSYGFHYLKFLIHTLIFNFKNISKAFVVATLGYHFFRMKDDIVRSEVA